MKNRELGITLIKYSVTVAVAAAIAVWIMFARGVLGGGLPLGQLYRYLSDAFFVPGALLMLIGALVYVSTTGLFDSLGYVGAVAVRALLPGMRMQGVERFGEYRERREKKRLSGYAFILLVGLFFLLLGVLFTVLFYTV